MPSKNLSHTIKELVSRDKMEKALDLILEACFHAPDSEEATNIGDEAIHHLRRLTRLNKEKDLRIISTEAYNLASNQISNAILDLANTGEVKDLPFPSPLKTKGQPKAIPVKTYQKQWKQYKDNARLDNIFKYLLMGVAAISFILLVIFITQEPIVYFKVLITIGGLIGGLFVYMYLRTIELVAHKAHVSHHMMTEEAVKKELGLSHL